MENHQGTKINLEKFTWIIESFSKKNTKELCSEPFEIGGYRWQIIVHPIGKGVDHLSLCLKVSGLLPAEKVKNLKERVVDLEIELRKLRTKLAVAEVDLEIARRDLEDVEKGFEERDIDAGLGYGT